MKIVEYDEIIDILYGCTLLGTGGGGNLKSGIKLIEKDIEDGFQLKMVSLNELPDDGIIATPYGCGAPASEDTYILPDETPSVLSFTALEDFMNCKFSAVSSTELGGENTAEALHAAMRLNLPIADGDPAGRSVPELQHSTYFIYNIPIYPLSVASENGEVVIIKNVCNDLRAEELVRSIAVVSNNEVGVTDHPMKCSLYKESVIPGAISYAAMLGHTLRNAQKNGLDVAKEIASKGNGSLRFKGHITKTPWEQKDGFNIGELFISGLGQYSQQEYKIWFKNENIISYLNGNLDACVPDLICLLDKNGDPITTPNFYETMEVSIVVLPSPEIWLSKRGLEIFGPESFGFDFSYSAPWKDKV